ncbi:hypothetical protein H310_09731 [Aphanomyces invadans]|uniref:Uncharacterized protein n=1 Tax=Aphanomyces invadans TaxID=157072 RepID=A0A024TVR3_9STRA|nr:hypothetical protein H310_09731 [Aphanomyces invadans]ETV97397.1 hypothetical protein H310_09731 [Aphanomyces invadans]|eukprot:XP_008874105.1 hypothetical protein H310_09731 [Aphanomyces invadans]
MQPQTHSSDVVSPQHQCYFNDCTAAALDGATKCHFHRHRGCCAVTDCRNQVYARQLCVKHGGKRQCAMPNCTANSRVGNLCSRHTTVSLKKTCSEPGCTKQPRALGRCVTHGGGKKCASPGCTSNARLTNHCPRHRRLLDQANHDKPAATPATYHCQAAKSAPFDFTPKLEYSIDPIWTTIDSPTDFDAAVHWALDSDCLEVLRCLDTIEM